jgi:hypothetical protein
VALKGTQVAQGHGLHRGEISILGQVGILETHDGVLRPQVRGQGAVGHTRAARPEDTKERRIAATGFQGYRTGVARMHIRIFGGNRSAGCGFIPKGESPGNPRDRWALEEIGQCQRAVEAVIDPAEHLYGQEGMPAQRKEIGVDAARRLLAEALVPNR